MKVQGPPFILRQRVVLCMFRHHVASLSSEGYLIEFSTDRMDTDRFTLNVFLGYSRQTD